MLRALCFALALLLPGCASMFGPDLSAAQINALSKDKSGSVVCLTAIGPYGTYKLATISLDQNVIKDGGISVDGNCVVSIQSQAPPRAAVVIVPAPAPLKPAI